MTAATQLPVLIINRPRTQSQKTEVSGARDNAPKFRVRAPTYVFVQLAFLESEYIVNNAWYSAAVKAALEPIVQAPRACAQRLWRGGLVCANLLSRLSSGLP